MNAADEGRDFLATVLWDDSCDWFPEDLDSKENWEIEVWLEELGYQWTGGAWVIEE